MTPTNFNNLELTVKEYLDKVLRVKQICMPKKLNYSLSTSTRGSIDSGCRILNYHAEETDGK